MSANPGSPFESLNEHIIASIFFHLTPEDRARLRAVSRQFCTIVNKHFKGFLNVWEGSEGFKQGKRQRFPLSFWKSNYASDYSSNGWGLMRCRSLVPRCMATSAVNSPLLTRIEFSGPLRLENVSRILLQSPNLKEIGIFYPSIVDKRIPDPIFTYALHLPKGLTSLKMITFPDEDLDFEETEIRLLRIFAQLDLEALEKFKLERRYQIHRIDWKQPKLEDSNLPWYLYMTKTQWMSLEQRQIISGILFEAKNSLRKVALNFTDCIILDNQVPTNLKSLELNWIGMKSLGWLNKLIDIERGSKLKRISLHIDLNLLCRKSRPVQKLVEQAKGLENLKIVAGNRFNDVDFNPDDLESSFAESEDETLDIFELDFILGCSKLKKLFLRGGPFKIIRNQNGSLPPNLSEFSIDGPIQVEALNLFASLPNLRFFDLSGFVQADLEETLDEMEENPAEIEKLDFKLSWPWLRELLTNSRSLQIVKISSCTINIHSILAHLGDVPGLFYQGPTEHFNETLFGAQKYRLDFQISIDQSVFNPIKLISM